jgi:hypothetical protein
MAKIGDEIGTQNVQKKGQKYTECPAVLKIPYFIAKKIGGKIN